LRVKLNYLQEWTNQRKEITLWYNETLQNRIDLVLPYVHEKADHAYYLYVVRTYNI
jgi:dTDP-4-amino-4,6-dideoxygalactose transaminase